MEPRRQAWEGIMASNNKTVDRLQHLETLYRRGYRSDAIDRSLDKIIALERETAGRELAELQERLRAFEARHRMSCLVRP